MRLGDLVVVARKYDFVNSYVQDVEVYTVHPTSTLHSMQDVTEIKAGETGVVLEVYKAPSGKVVWVRALFSRAHGWIDSEHLDIAERYEK